MCDFTKVMQLNPQLNQLTEAGTSVPPLSPSDHAKVVVGPADIASHSFLWLYSLLGAYSPVQRLFSAPMCLWSGFSQGG